MKYMSLCTDTTISMPMHGQAGRQALFKQVAHGLLLYCPPGGKRPLGNLQAAQRHQNRE